MKDCFKNMMLADAQLFVQSFWDMPKCEQDSFDPWFLLENCLLKGWYCVAFDSIFLKALGTLSYSPYVVELAKLQHQALLF